MENLKTLLKERKISVDRLAGLTGVTRQTVHKYLKGQSVPDARWLIKTANICRCSVDYLLDLTECKTYVEFARYYYEEDYEY